MCAQASGRLSGKYSDINSPPFFTHGGRERRAIRGILFGIDTAQKLLLEMGAINTRCRARVFHWLKNFRLILDDAIDWAEQTSRPF